MADDGRVPDVTSLGDDRFRVDDDGGTRVAFAIADGRSTWVFLDGHTFVFRATHEGARTPGPEAESSLSAPMPARVLSVAVEVGQAVARGDVLVTLEAMKMELPIRAPRDGTVASISCQTGRMVGTGDPLVELT